MGELIKRISRFSRLMSTLIGMVLLVGGLSACQISAPLPGNRVVEQAIALQVSLTQPDLSRQLRLTEAEAGEFAIQRVAIAERTPLTIQQLPAFRIQGTYNLVFKLPNRQVSQQQNPFDIYLQLQKEAKTWRLLRPTPDHSWLSYLIE